jgi:acetyl-CoA acetyltransferase family protein
MLSAVPFLADRAAWYTDPDLRDRLDWTPAAMGAELMAWREGYDRADIAAVTIRSHGRAASAWREGRFNTGVVPVLNPSGEVALDQDEWVRPKLDPDRLAGLAPLFGDDAASTAARAVVARRFPDLAGREPVMTSAHVPGFTDGAALVLLGSARAGERAGLRPRARIRAMAERGGDAVDQFQAGFDAMDAALAQAGLTLDQVDLIEFMEAFAAPPLRFERTRAPDMNRVNVNGGHLAMGHPMGATGAVLTGVLLDELERRGGETGLVVTLGAGGVGSALVIDRA